METANQHVGKKVRLVRDVDRYPHFIARAGSTGVINHWHSDQASVRMDAPLIGAEEWNNCILWESQEGECMWDDVEEISREEAL
jgi:hypothetical protein